MKKFLCKLFKCCPTELTPVQASQRLSLEVVATSSFYVREQIFRNALDQPTRTFEVAILAPYFIFSTQKSLQVALDKVLAAYHCQ